MRRMKWLSVMLCSLILYGGVYGYDRSAGPVVSAAETLVAENKPLAQSPGKQADIQVQMSSCSPENPVHSGKSANPASVATPANPGNSKHDSKPQANWRNLKPYRELDGIAAISTGKIFDEAGYGWKPGISYAIAKDGTVWSWGYAEEAVSFPKRLEGLKRVRQISGSFALTTDGDVWQLAEGKSPKQVDGLRDILSIGEMEMHGALYLLKRDGTVWRLDQETKKLARLPELANIREIDASFFSLFILEQNGKLLYLNGRSGGLADENAQPVEVPGRVARVSTGYDGHALIQTDKGEVYVFAPKEKALQRMPQADGAKALAVAGNGTYFFVKADGSVWGWGENISGLLGENRPDMVEAPVPIDGLSGIADVKAGTDHALALDNNGHVYSWGSNMTGQLGRIPVIFDRWTEIGELANIRQAVTQLERPYFVLRDGSIWSLADDRSAYQVQGPANIEKLASIYKLPVTLDKDGQVRIWSDRFTACQTLSLPAPVKNVVGGEEHLLLQTKDDRFLTVEFKPEYEERAGHSVVSKIIPGKAEFAVADPAWTSRVTALYANNHTFFALTDDGRAYYADKSADTPFSFAPMKGLPKLKALAPEYFIRYTVEPESVWALDENGRVHEIIVHKVPPYVAKLEAIKAKTGDAKENGVLAISGRLRITKDGHIFEHEWEPFKRQAIPDQVRLISSVYDYAIEGPGSHYHLLVTAKDKLVVIGYNPFGHLSSKLDKVVVQ
ncbi:regulator [Brevibacillus borstelensis]|uniref:RCC1 domain-containing protein n=1 Tax=Brevibacillus borstelensis TaxID=45462 RepID=UPI0030C41452